MKTLLSFLLLFLFLLGFGQDAKKFIRCQQEQDEDSILYQKLTSEKKLINYNNLYETIINDIDKDKLKTENLVVLLSEITHRSPYDEEPCFCCFERLSTNPNYNDTIFWKKKTFKIISKKLNKNVVPKISTYGNFIYEPSRKVGGIIYKNLYSFLSRKNRGKIIYYSEENGVDEEKYFYYFPFFKNKKLILEESLNNGNRNYDTLKIEFINELNGKVLVTFKYNFEPFTSIPQDIIHKTYQYQKGEWKLIEDYIEKYKF